MAVEGTPLRQLADLLVDGGLDEFIRSRRPRRSWRLIARDLYEATDHRVDVTYVTLRSWYPADDPAPVDAIDDDVEDQIRPLARSA